MCMTNYQEMWVESLNVEFLPKLLLTSTFSHLEIKGLTISKTLVWKFTCTRHDNFTNKTIIVSRGMKPLPIFFSYSFIIHRLIYAQTGSMLISHFQVTSWFDTTCIITKRWVSLKKNATFNMN